LEVKIIVLRTPSNIPSSTNQAYESESLQTPPSVPPFVIDPTRSQNTLIAGHSIIDSSLEEDPSSPPNRLTELDPSLLNAQEFLNEVEVADLPQPNPLQMGSSLQGHFSVVGHELESYPVSRTSSNETSSTAQEVCSQTSEDSIDSQQQHLAAYYRQLYYRKEQNRLAEQVVQEEDSRQFEEGGSLDNEQFLEGDDAYAHESESGGLGGSPGGGGRGSTTISAPFPPSGDDDSPQVPSHFDREAPIQEQNKNQSIGEGSFYQPNDSVQNPQPDRSLGQNQNIGPEAGGRFPEIHRPLHPSQGGRQVHPAPQPGPSGTPVVSAPSGPI